MDPNETFDTFMRELSNRVICDVADEGPDDDDVPDSLLRYLETSRSRAAACEKLILEELEDFPASHPTEDAMDFHLSPNEQAACDPEDEENNTSNASRLLPAPTEAEAVFTHNASVCPNNEGEQKHSVSEEEAEPQQRHCSKMKGEELKRQIERDFQTELKKMMEAEKLHQKELELMGRRAQEKLDQEWLLQQELMSDLQRRVQEERRMWEEEQKRMKDEEEKRTREEEKIRIEAERKEMEEEMRRKKEEERRIEEMKLKKEEERKREQEEKRRVEREEKRKREEKNKMEMEKRKLEEEMRMMKEEEEREKRKREQEEKRRVEREEKRKREERNKMEKRKLEEEMRMMKEEEEKWKREEEIKNIEEEAKKKVEKEKRKMEEDIRQKEEERKKREEENRKIEEEVRITKEIEERRKEEERRKHKEKEDEEALKKLHAEMKKRDEKEQSPLSELRKKEEEDRKTKEEPRPIEEEEKRKRENERKTKEEERRRRTEEDLRQEDEEGHRKEEAEMKLTEDEDNRKMEQQSKTKQKKQEKEEEEELKEEEAGENQKEVNSEEEITLTEEEGSKKRVMHDGEKEGRGASEPKEKTGNHMTSSSAEHDPDPKVGPTSTDPAAGPPEEKRLAWMKDCVRWSKLQNRSQQGGPAQSRRGPRGSAGSGGLAPLCPDAVLRSTGCRSLKEVPSVTLEDLPGCGLSTLARCSRLRSLTLRRCGLRSLEGINQLAQLCHVDVQENDISLVDCDHMSGLRVLLLAHNKLTSIHGLAGAEHLGVLDLSHNSITRIAGLESTRRLQRLSVDHNQLISTRGLGGVCTLLHLSCSHNHLASVEGLENSALLSSLDLRANSLAEPPSLSNQVLLRELHLDDNNISSLQGLAACWLPLMQRLSVAQNRITRLPPMSDFVSLENLDLRFNCMSELQNVCDGLEGCGFLQELHLEGNPLQQERGWRAALQRAAPGLRALDGQRADSAPAAPAGRVGLCQAQLQQTVDLQRQHSRELSGASSSLDAVTASCRHLSEALQLAVDQRLAHEHGDATTGRRTPAAERPETGKSAGKLPPVLPSGSSHGFDPVGPKTGPPSNHEVEPVSSNQHLDLQNTAAAVVIQQLWRKYRQKCGNISSLSVAEKGGGGGGGGDKKPESGPSYVGRSVVDPHYAATVIQACWRGVALRRRRSPASALAAASRPDAEEDDDAFEFEEVDVDEFVFDEKRWTLSFSEDPPPRRCPASEPPLKFFLPPPLVWRPKQAWVPGGQVDSAGPAPETSNRTLKDFRNRSLSSPPAPSGLSQRSERILEEWGFTDSHTALLMLKRAQKMKPAQRQKKRSDPSIRPAFRSSIYPLAPVEARHIRSETNSGEAEGAELVEGAEPVTRAAHPDSHSESVHFLPEISSDVLSGGRVQLVADPAYTTRPAARPAGEHGRPRRNSYGPSSGELPAPRRVASAPSKRERISHRDSAVQLSGGWGGGKKRGKEYK